MRCFIWFVMLAFAFSAAAQSQQTKTTIAKKYEDQLTQSCAEEINKDQRIAALTARQTRQICRCAAPLTLKKVVKETIRDVDLVMDVLLLDFLHCGSNEIKHAYSANYRQKGIKVRNEYFDVKPAAALCLANLEYASTVDAVISKSSPNLDDFENQMLQCVLLK